jgi:hypothetical protein
MLVQHMLELLELLELELIHDPELTIRLANDVSPNPDAICGRTVTNKTKLAAAMTPMRARGFQLFTAPPRSLPRSSRPVQNILRMLPSGSDGGPVGHGAAR